jgi:hypothetical protein
MFKFLRELLSKWKNEKKLQKLDVNILPSQGYFYSKNLEIYYRNADLNEIKEYNEKISVNIYDIIKSVKKIVKNNLKFVPNDFKFEDLCSIDILFIFIKIVEETKQEPIYINDIKFDEKNFQYFYYKKYHKNYNADTREFIFNDWKFSLPRIGIEKSLTDFFYELKKRNELDKYENGNYDLIYFLGGKSSLTYDELKNLVDLGNDLKDEDKSELKNIISKFQGNDKYVLSDGENVTKVSPIALVNIWGNKIYNMIN